MRHWRINFVLLVLTSFGLFTIGHLFFIQVKNGEFYQALIKGLQSLEAFAAQERGEIMFGSGEYLAINREWPFIFASPREIGDKTAAAGLLSQALGLNKETLLADLENNNLYLALKRRPNPEQIDKIKELDIKGVYIGVESGRYYPQANLASQVLGFLGAEGRGQYGLEEYYDQIIQGQNSKGSGLVLTLDYAVQFKARELLAKAKENLNIQEGEIIVVDPNTGKIIALAVFPGFDPNQYSEVADYNIFQNSASQKIFEPGSVFKPITMAAALEEGKITPQTTYLDKGHVKIGGRTIYNYDERVYGEQTMTGVLEKSINTGAVFAESQIGHNVFLKYIDNFGIFEPTGVDLPETYSENLEFKKGYEINFATAAFGQGVEMTTLQLARAYSVLANGGNLLRPYLVKEVKNGKDVQKIDPEVQTKGVISPKTASQITAMMVSVVENGFGKAAKIPGYYIAGKTGTAQISYAALGQNKLGYSDETWQTFAGWFPAFDPKALIVVKLTNPETKTAEYSAGPIFKEMAKYIIDYYQIPPDYEL